MSGGAQSFCFAKESPEGNDKGVWRRLEIDLRGGFGKC